MLCCFAVSLSLGKALGLSHVDWAFMWGWAGNGIQRHVFCSVNAEMFLAGRCSWTCLMMRKGLILHPLRTFMGSLVQLFVLYTF